MKKRKVAFWCLPFALHKESKEFFETINKSDDFKIHNSHTTLYFGKEKGTHEKLFHMIGEKIVCTVGNLYYTKDVCCYTVTLSRSDIYFGDSFPHITVATFGDAKPVKSNEILLTDSKFMKTDISGMVYEAKVCAAIYTSDGLIYTSDQNMIKI